MSKAAAGLFRALVQRSGLPRDRVLLSACVSTDWQSLTFAGERHHLLLRLVGEDAAGGAERLTLGLADAEFAVPGQLVADIALAGMPVRSDDGSITIEVEALTVED